ncbi:hypothetical protein BSU04_25875 [Caballeronia sordidicola]|uniref:Uncharacterized protein n=1 Tax=Caballeronia sordidicola TaxID=196367 RepID=A0A226WWU1_CABSO|nr:hypothetical protein BSU04_25875 [Caballeronia sordidicola]
MIFRAVFALPVHRLNHRQNAIGSSVGVFRFYGRFVQAAKFVAGV